MARAETSSSYLSPLVKYHLTRNPFGELTPAERAALAVVELPKYLDWLQRPKAALQFIGPCGHGKSTHLLALERALENSTYVYFPETGLQPLLPRNRTLLVDEAQRMCWRRRRALLANPGPLIIGTHVDLESALKRAGFDVCTVDLSEPISAEKLKRVLNQRILASRTRIPGSITSDPEAFHPLCLTLEQVVALQHRFGSNIRSIEHFLYEAFLRFAQKGEPWLPVR